MLTIKSAVSLLVALPLCLVAGCHDSAAGDHPDVHVDVHADAGSPTSDAKATPPATDAGTSTPDASRMPSRCPLSSFRRR